MNDRDKVNTSRCFFCPKRTDIEVHHILPRRFNGSDARENLVAVCDACHEKLELLYDKSFYSALGIDDADGERYAHFPCIRCETQATTKIARAGTVSWFCDGHAEEALTSIDATVVKEVSEK
jgi:hypothetical protein